MDLNWLEDFLALAESRSFSRAAEVRGVTQSAFSRRIRALEDWLGAGLISRESHPVTLTDEGRQFRETAEEVLRMLTTSRDTFRHRAHGAGPQVALTSLHSLAVTFLPAWLMQVQGRIGPVASRVMPDNFDRCIVALTEGGYDFFLTYHHPGVEVPLGSGYPALVIGHDRLSAVARPGWPAVWATAGMPLIQYSRGSFLGKLAQIAQTQPGAPLAYVAHVNEASMAEAMKSMALQGHGVVWLPQSLVAADIAAGRLEVVAPELPMEIRLYRNAARGRALSSRVWAAAAEMAQDHANSE
ncbi:MAG: LysR family transcriptional regulator [Rhodobacteraceae bacterium]|nr:LysR family transcriptional regulator [Paracoccaceae bacterium]